MTTLSRVLAYGLAVLLAGGLLVLAIAGVTAATAVLVTAAGIVGMIALGGVLGGRAGTRRPPVTSGHEPPGTVPPSPAAPDEGASGGTMEG